MITIKDYYADWCSPCKTIAPILEEVKNELGINLLKIDVDSSDNNDDVIENNIRNIPTLLFIKDGEIRARHSGTISKDKLINLINNL